MGQFCINVLAQIFVVLCFLYRFSFVIELTVVAGNVLGFPYVEFQLVSVK